MRTEHDTDYVACEHCGRGQTFFYDARDPLSWERQAALALGTIPHQPTCPRFQDRPDRASDLSKLQTSFC